MQLLKSGFHTRKMKNLNEIGGFTCQPLVVLKKENGQTENRQTDNRQIFIGLKSDFRN